MGGEGSYHVNKEPEASSDVGICLGTARYTHSSRDGPSGLPQPRASAPVTRSGLSALPQSSPTLGQNPGSWAQVATSLSE